MAPARVSGCSRTSSSLQQLSHFCRLLRWWVQLHVHLPMPPNSHTGYFAAESAKPGAAVRTPEAATITGILHCLGDATS